MNDMTMQTEVQPMPKTLGGLVAYLTLDGAQKAADVCTGDYAAMCTAAGIK